MNAQDFSTTISVKAPAIDIFNAVNNVRGWWSENIEGDTDIAGNEFLYHYQDVHRARIQVVDLVPGKKIEWKVIDNFFSFTKDKNEWKDTRIIFDITSRNGVSEMKFTHVGLVPEYECFNVCYDAWTHYIHTSLKELIITGKGIPTPKISESATAPDDASADINSKNKSSDNNDVSKTIAHRLTIATPVETVYLALTTQKGLQGWWTPDSTATPETGSVSRFGFGPDYYKKLRVVQLQPYSIVEWKVVHAFEDWIGTKIRFQIDAHKKGAVVSFYHEGWKEYSPEFASCSYDWALFLKSLKMYCETGKGLPYPEFNK